MKLSSFVSTLVLGAGLTASSLFANTISINPTGFNGVPDGNGGEFLAKTSDNGSFVTFCVEEHVLIQFGTVYSYTIDGPVTKYQNDNISVGTAWLYESFRSNTLSGSLGGNYLDQHDLNAGLLQKAIWALESESADSNYYTALVTTKFGSLANAKLDYTGAKVAVMNVWGPLDKNGKLTDIQSQLILVPDSGTTTALLGLGLLSVAFFRSRL